MATVTNGIREATIMDFVLGNIGTYNKALLILLAKLLLIGLTTEIWYCLLKKNIVTLYITDGDRCAWYWWERTNPISQSPAMSLVAMVILPSSEGRGFPCMCWHPWGYTWHKFHRPNLQGSTRTPCEHLRACEIRWCLKLIFGKVRDCVRLLTYWILATSSNLPLASHFRRLCPSLPLSVHWRFQNPFHYRK